MEINVSITDSVFHLDAPSIPPTDANLLSTQFEFYGVTLPQGGVQTWSSAGFSGSVDIKGLEGVDKIAPVVPVTGAVKGPKTVEQGDKPKFKFSSATAGATFQCKLDKKAGSPARHRTRSPPRT